MRLVTSCVRLACDVELLSNNRQPRNYTGVINEIAITCGVISQ